MTSTTSLHSSSRRLRLLESARARFFTLGFAATRMEDVASDAGFSKRTVYLEFPSKGALFAALCEEAIGILRDLLTSVLGSEQDVVSEIHAIATLYLRFYNEHRSHYRLLFRDASDDTLKEVAPEQKKRIHDVERVCVGVLARAIARARAEGVLRSDLDPWRYAVAVWGAQNGILMIHEHALRVDLAGVPIEELYWTTYEAFLRGALPVASSSPASSSSA